MPRSILANIEIDEASMVRRMVSAEASGTDVTSAMAKVGRAIGTSRWTVWGIYHGRRKDIGGTLMRKVRLAYVGHCERQLARFEAELRIAKARCGDDRFSDLDREIADLAAKIADARERAV